MPTTKPKILIVFAKHGSDTSTRFGGFVKRIRANGGFKYAEVDYVALEDLIFRVYSAKKARVFDPVRNIETSDYSFVYFKAWQSMADEASSLARYLEGVGVPYVDIQVRSEMRTKTTNQMAMWASGIPTPPSIWGSKNTLMSYIDGRALSYPRIVKAINGEKGRDNYLVHSKHEALEIIEASHTPMIMQEFIPNDGDYRIGVYGSMARWGIFRFSDGKSHLNNTSAGAGAELLDIADIDKTVLDIAERAAKACDLAISGVDVVEHRDTKKLYVLEANQGSQIVTGAFRESKIKAFSDGMSDMVMQRPRHLNKPKRLPIVGRYVGVHLVHPEAEVTIRAKVDTGAYRSAVGVDYIEQRIDDDGREFLAYGIKCDNGIVSDFVEYDFDKVKVRSSFGHEELRYFVPIEVLIFGVKYRTKATLADRSKLKRTMLLGRMLLAGNFLVDVRYTRMKDDL